MKQQKEIQFQGKPVSRFEFRGSGSSLLFRYLKNIVLTALTFGLYFYWARVEMREFIWSNIYIGKNKLEYIGTGLELLLGNIKFLVVFFSFILIMAIAMRIPGPMASFSSVVFLATMIFFAPFATYSARRFLLSRTEYAGTRFSMSDDAKDYALICIKHGFLTLITLGLHYPIFSNEKYKFKMSRTYYGNQRFHYDADPSALRSTFLWCWVLFLPTFGLSFYWYRAREMCFQVCNTRLGEISFLSHFLGHELLMYEVLSKVGMILSLGLLAPWIMTWKLRYHISSFALVGQITKATSAEPRQKPSALSDQISDVIGSNVV